jgi:ABC-type multidrug transport system ATPase subunit
MTYAIELKQITKRYKDTIAVKNLNIQVPRGKVYGFLGRNGAGKTTTLRIIMGLVKQNSGSVYIMGKNAKENRLFVLSNIGAIVESPGFYRNLSAEKNLRITADLYGTDKNRTEEVLKIVGLSAVGKRKVKTFSTGMKQRLGIANALVHSPDILILDEPTNGLDPEGVKDLRSFIRNLSGELGITILVSSHILSEVEQIADHVGILDQGKLVEQFNIQDFRLTDQSYLLLEVDQLQRTALLLKENEIEYTLSDNQLKVYCPKEKNGDINNMMTSNNIIISNMSSIKNSLEDRFLSVVGGK